MAYARTQRPRIECAAGAQRGPHSSFTNDNSIFYSFFSSFRHHVDADVNGFGSRYPPHQCSPGDWRDGMSIVLTTGSLLEIRRR